MGGIEHDALGCAAGMRGDDRGAGEDLDVPGTAPDFDRLANERKRHRVGAALEGDGAVARHAARDGDVERLGQGFRQRTQVYPLALPGAQDISAGGRTRALGEDLDPARIGMGLQRLEAVPVAPIGAAAEASVADAPLDLALRLGASRWTGVDVEAQGLGIAFVCVFR